MLKPVYPKKPIRVKKANDIAEKLLSKELFPIHGQFIDANTAKSELGLEVEILGMQDQLLAGHLGILRPVRGTVGDLPCTRTRPPKIKLFESSQASLITPG